MIYQPGELRVVACENGKQWASETVKTTGDATQIAMSADRANIKNEGDDLSFITVVVADAAG